MTKQDPGRYTAITGSSQRARANRAGLAFLAALAALSLIAKQAGFITPTAPEAQNSTKQERTAEATKASKTNDKYDNAFKNAALGAYVLLKTLRDPDSLIIDEAFYHPDRQPSACLRYRAKNGFGGMNREFILVTPVGVSQDAKEWDQFCSGSGLLELDAPYVKSFAEKVVEREK